MEPSDLGMLANLDARPGRRGWCAPRRADPARSDRSCLRPDPAEAPAV